MASGAAAQGLGPALPGHPLAHRGVVRRLAHQRGAALGLVVLGALVLLAVAAPWISPRDPIKAAPRDALQPPGARYLLGSDQYGRDVASRVLHGARDVPAAFAEQPPSEV